MGVLMRPKVACVWGSTKDMEKAFQNILNEIIEHVIEGMCFEVHRAVKLGYYPIQEYILSEHNFGSYQNEEEELSEPEGQIIYGDENGSSAGQLLSACRYCNQLKAAHVLLRHMKGCKSRPKDNSTVENNVDGNSSDGKKGNAVKRQVKSTQNYDTMTAEQKQDFLAQHCGVVSKRTGKPCIHSLNCNTQTHTPEARAEIRRLIFESFADHLADGNIDIDTVD